MRSFIHRFRSAWSPRKLAWIEVLKTSWDLSRRYSSAPRSE